MSAHKLCMLLCACLFAALVGGCGEDNRPAAPAKPKLAQELVFYDWADDMPQSVLDAFTSEFGIKVTYRTYENDQEMLESLRAGTAYDVAVADNHIVPQLVAEGLLAEIEHRNIPNLKHLSPSFRDLVFDPGNRYSVTYNWGLTFLLQRVDPGTPPVNGWADLWSEHFAGRVHLWNLQRTCLGLALKSLGYSINSENPAELEAALQRLLTLKGKADFSGYTPEKAMEILAGGSATLIYGWAGDVVRARNRNLDIRHVLPAEGTIQWGDNFVIPKASRAKETAEVFINFLMRPEISAQIVNEQHYATANQSAQSLIKPEILSDAVIFPPKEQMIKAEVYLPLSKEGQMLHDRIWQRLLAGLSAAEVLEGTR